MASKHISIGLVLGALTSLSWMLFQLHVASIPAGIDPFPAPDQSSHPSLKAAYGKLPLTFEVNQGQTDRRVKFLSRGGGYSLFLTGTAAVLSVTKEAAGSSGKERLTSAEAKKVQATTLRMDLVGANSAAAITGLEELPGKVNYFIGDDPMKWRTNVATYAKVKYNDVYPGVDLVYYGNQQELEYDFIVAPGAEPKAIMMSFGGADQVKVDEQGDLVLRKEPGGVRQRRPLIYQEINGEQKKIEGRYLLLSPTLVGFELGPYDTKRALVIDPVLSYATYLGGGGDDRIPLIAVDATGQVYLAGNTSSANFPTVNPVQPSFGGGPFDLFVAKLNAGGTALLYSTYFGGSGMDTVGSIAVDSAGSAYVTGQTNSINFPRMDPLQPAFAGGLSDAFVTKLNADGSALVYSTYLGGGAPGGENSNDIKVDASGSAYVTGQTTSTSFPTVNALQPTLGGAGDAFVAKLNAAGSALVYSTYLGGVGPDMAIGVAVDSTGNAYVHGQTGSLNFPTVNPLQPANSGGMFDVFVAKLDATGASLVYSTYLGGSGRDLARAIAVDATGNAYVTGFALSTDFPVVNAVQPTHGGGGTSDAFVAKLNADGTALVYSTYLGGALQDAGEGLAVDAAGNAYVAGFTSSTNFPTVNPLQEKYAGPPGGGAIGGDGWVAKLNSDGSALVYSTYLGGSGEEEIVSLGVDAAGNVYVTGQTTSMDFPTAGPPQPAYGGGPADVFIVKISEMTRPYSITNRGGVSFSISGSSTLTAGYARIQPNTGSTAASGVAIFGFRANNVLVSEAGVPASPLVSSGRIYADIGGSVNTGIAMANGNNQSVTASFFLTNEAGQNSTPGSVTIPANGQISRFLNEAPFKAGSSFRGTLTFNTSAPIGVIALRGFTNERSEFLITTLPVVDMSGAVSETAVIPHFADGGGWTTTVVLVNSTDAPESGSIQFFGQGSAAAAAQPLSVTINNQANNTFSYTVPARTSVRFQTAGSTTDLRAGSVRVIPAGTSRTPSALAIFSFKSAGVTVSEAGVPALPAGSAFRMYVEASGDFGQSAAGSIQSGIAIANPSSIAVPVNFELTSLGGVSTGLSSSVTVPAQGQVAIFLNQIQGFQSLPLPFQGVLRISTASSSGISMVGLRGRYNERKDFLITTTPPVSEASTASNAEMLFPHWASGGGYSTQFILFSGVPSQTSAGMLRFFSQTGQPLI